MTDHLGGVTPVYPCSWCGKHTSYQIVDCQHFEAPTLWRRWCSQQCRNAWLNQQHSTEHVNAWGQS